MFTTIYELVSIPGRVRQVEAGGRAAQCGPASTPQDSAAPGSGVTGPAPGPARVSEAAARMPD
eukprot:527086-Hanusia_phi.AAC.1